MSKLACPKCHQPLYKENNSYKCKHNHCFDLAKSGYLNVLLNSDKASSNPGDSKESLLSRRAFLQSGYYDIILNEVLHTIHQYTKPQTILDLGCGEGYYTSKIKETFKESEVYGLDISKTAINMATRYHKDIYWLVANNKNLPILSDSMDVITALFTVINENEIKRCLKDDGYMIHVTANNDHLMELKELIYDEVIQKDDHPVRLSMALIDSYSLKEKIHLATREDTLNLLSMTPHFYHIKKDKRYLLDSLEDFDVTLSITISIYKKKSCR